MFFLILTENVFHQMETVLAFVQKKTQKTIRSMMVIYALIVVDDGMVMNCGNNMQNIF